MSCSQVFETRLWGNSPMIYFSYLRNNAEYLHELTAHIQSWAVRQKEAEIYR